METTPVQSNGVSVVQVMLGGQGNKGEERRKIDREVAERLREYLAKKGMQGVFHGNMTTCSDPIRHIKGKNDDLIRVTGYDQFSLKMRVSMKRNGDSVSFNIHLRVPHGQDPKKLFDLLMGSPKSDTEKYSIEDFLSALTEGQRAVLPRLMPREVQIIDGKDARLPDAFLSSIDEPERFLHLAELVKLVSCVGNSQAVMHRVWHVNCVMLKQVLREQRRILDSQTISFEDKTMPVNIAEQEPVKTMVQLPASGEVRDTAQIVKPEVITPPTTMSEDKLKAEKDRLTADQSGNSAEVQAFRERVRASLERETSMRRELKVLEADRIKDETALKNLEKQGQDLAKRLAAINSELVEIDRVRREAEESKQREKIAMLLDMAKESGIDRELLMKALKESV